MIREAIKGAAVAAAVCSMFASGAARAADKPKEESKTVRCAGVNACKGQGACGGADNACKSKNACKGKGWIQSSEKECKDKGGKIVDEK
jgi:hypothetical protein